MQQVVDSIIAVVALVQFLKTKNLWSQSENQQKPRLAPERLMVFE
jgi:hypothetical protein